MGLCCFHFQQRGLYFINVSCQNENSLHSDQEMALYEKKYMEGRGASVFPWFLAGAQTLSGALSTLELPGGHGAGLNWLDCGNPNVGTNRLVGCHRGCQMFRGCVLMNNYQLDFMKN